MFISRYTEKDDRKKHFTYSTGIEKNKLFVKNISFEQCTDEILRKVFQKYGELKDIRIVSHKYENFYWCFNKVSLRLAKYVLTFRTGRPKGIAYVEYNNSESAANALKAVDGLELGGRNLVVALSAPPPKNTALPEFAPLSSSYVFSFIHSVNH